MSGQTLSLVVAARDGDKTFTQTITVNVTEVVDTIIGTTGADSLVGTIGPDFLSGLDGNDTLVSGGGDDRLLGGAGADSLVGGAGNDRYDVDALDSIRELAGGGMDRVVAGVSVTLATWVENLALTGTAAANGTGNLIANALVGNAGANLLSGLDGNDVLTGGAGNDTLVGGAGADRLDAGTGSNVYRFDAPGVVDRVLSYVIANDAIEVSAVAFGGGLAVGDDLAALGRFVAGGKVNQAVGQFLWNEAAGRLSWDADGTGSGGAVVVAILPVGLALTASEISVIA